MQASQIYALLQINENTSDDHVRKQYKRMCQIWHPDKHLGNIEKATARFVEIKHAYESWLKLPKEKRSSTRNKESNDPYSSATPTPKSYTPKESTPKITPACIPTVHTATIPLNDCFKSLSLLIPCDTWIACKDCCSTGCPKCQHKGYILKTVPQPIIITPADIQKKPFRVQGKGFTLLLRTTILKHTNYFLKGADIHAVVEITSVPKEKTLFQFSYIDGEIASFYLDEYTRNLDTIEIANKGLYRSTTQRGSLLLQVHVKSKTR